MRLEADLQLELTDDGGGAQPIEALWQRCRIWVADEYKEMSCSFGIDWSWDGEDELGFVDADCDLTITR